MVRSRKGLARRAYILAALLASASSFSGLRAQGIAGELLESDLPFSPSRGRNIAVPDRPRPAYEATGVRAGSFIILPKVEVGLGYLDNVYSSSINPKGDGYAFIAPSVLVKSDWSRHGISLAAGAEHQEYFKVGSESHTDWYVEGQGRYDIAGESNIALIERFAKTTEPRYSEGFPDDAAEPVPVRTIAVTGRGTYQGARVRLIGAGSITRLNYQDVDSFSGGRVDQDYRDRRIIRFSGRAEYAFTPDASAFVQYSHARIKYDNFTLPIDNRSSDENQFLGGISMDLSGVMRGTIGLGYVERNFDLANYRNSHGFVADARLEWFVTQLTTVTATAHRYLRDSAIRGAGGYYDTQVGLRADHELLRNLLLFVQGEYRWDKYQIIDRRDRIGFVGGGARYLMNPSWEIGGRVEYTDRTSHGADRGRDINELRALVSVTWKR
jgi:hypothetical protein